MTREVFKIQWSLLIRTHSGSFDSYTCMGMWRDALRRIPPIGFFLSRSEWQVHEGAPTRFMVASGGGLSEGGEHGGPGVCLGDGQTEVEGVPSQGGRGDALLRRIPHT